MVSQVDSVFHLDNQDKKRDKIKINVNFIGYDFQDVEQIFFYLKIVVYFKFQIMSKIFSHSYRKKKILTLV